ncbi:hypothetical protein [Rhodoferax sp.]|uniref:hypothetical protein n=1 Tax=Rhodoferax sp. TaxID=50421 RepID=UPI0027346DBF|nr:hypothetical protein [Rhodoferax sp.]MDP3193126.1 hypothetical protein [Rhodoferax sp.]MDP3336101.1 hypothetical protein [Rhodoferax sp.]
MRFHTTHEAGQTIADPGILQKRKAAYGSTQTKWRQALSIDLTIHLHLGREEIHPLFKDNQDEKIKFKRKLGTRGQQLLAL